jgi:uncharacterized protein (UPF0248 family)
MRTAREILNEIRWREDKDIAKVEVHYIHRGAPGDTAVIRGGDIGEIGHMFFEVETGEGGPGVVDGRASIPFHRILRIVYDGEVVFSRPHE